MSNEDLSYHYFPEDYRWSHGVLIGLNSAPWGGAEIGEIHRIGLRLRPHMGDDTAWFREWAREAGTVEAAGRRLLAEGRRASAAAYVLRAANYYHVGERFLQPKSEGLDAYRRGVECFRDAAQLVRRPRIEHVEIPYEGAALPGILVHAEPLPGRTGAVPAVVFFDGFDITKEIQYFKGVPDLVARGIACLVDLQRRHAGGRHEKARGIPPRRRGAENHLPVPDGARRRRRADPARAGAEMLRRGRLEAQTMKVFTRAVGGYHHCQIDNASIGVAYMWDWLE